MWAGKLLATADVCREIGYLSLVMLVDRFITNHHHCSPLNTPRKLCLKVPIIQVNVFLPGFRIPKVLVWDVAVVVILDDVVQVVTEWRPNNVVKERNKD